MKFRVQIALGSALLLGLASFATVLAKGEFSFLTISGPGLEQVVRVTERSLTSDYFAFADFYRDGTEAPADPGIGYEITRYYLDAGHEAAFDRLFYYPKAGFVYYEGLINGETEYDAQWYSADPDIKASFEAVIFEDLPVIQPQGSAGAGASILPAQPVPPIVAAGIVFLLAILFRFREPLFKWR